MSTFKMQYQTTITAVSIHPVHCNPIFGAECTHVMLEDEAGGCFIVIEQDNDEAKVGTIRVTLEELTLIVEASKTLMGQQGVK